ncbi:histidine phosphatase family protein [Wenjunlia tyrosinilytica]|uniref:Phosphoglycerate mutase n=1 Tax=Wenjunlia tyrosinilytica TaxID=1544741 RepID=A0A917ZVD7_9ACTN|nr:histidine phosphatase family protein [Wenjunlia tyrosinilytica]GGO93993.1 phosphoglycerate mutase [Wenjunlia tyrosinilytica]
MTTLILVRHGETVWHAENRYTGRSDVALTREGLAQAERLGDRAKGARLAAIWTSPLSRARSTAAPAARSTGLEPHVDDRLREIDFGAGEGLTAAQMRERFPEARAAFLRDPVAHHLPGGEHPADAVARALPCLREITESHPDGRVLVVGHSTLGRLLLCHFLEVPLSRYRQLFPAVRNCGITEVRWDGDRSVSLLEFNTPVDSPVD